MTVPGFDLSGKRALVVGAGSAVGGAVALALAEAGADVAVASATTAAQEALALQRLSRQVVAMGHRSPTQSIDVTNSTAVQVTVRQVARDLGGLDVLVNCQDAYLGKPFDKVSDAEWLKVMNLNLSSVFYCCRAAAREMLRQGGGKIVNIASALGSRGLANSAAYAAAKGGVIQLTRSLAQEYARQGVRINCIAPAWLEDTPGAGSPVPEENLLVRYIPMKRLGRADEVGPLAVYLASDACDFITGQVLFVDGGLLCHL